MCGADKFMRATGTAPSLLFAELVLGIPTLYPHVYSEFQVLGYSLPRVPARGLCDHATESAVLTAVP